jgi:hypothetical protein
MTMQCRFELRSSALLVLLLGRPVVLAGQGCIGQQTAGQAMLTPLAETSNPICGKYATMGNGAVGICGMVADFPWYAAGAGFTSELKVENAGDGSIQVQYIYQAMEGEDAPNDADLFLYTTFTSLGVKSPIPEEGAIFAIPSGDFAAFSVDYPAEYNGTFDPPPLPNQLQTGPIAVSVFGPDEATLDAVVFTLNISDANSKRVVNIPLLPELNATSSEELTLMDSMDNFAVENIGDDCQEVLVSLTRDGVLMASFTTSPLPPDGVYEGTLAGSFQRKVPATDRGLWHLMFQALGGDPILPAVFESQFDTRTLPRHRQ